jgi:serine/threonine protein kinase
MKGLVNENIMKYRIQKKIGTGVFSSIYRAIHPPTKLFVA